MRLLTRRGSGPEHPAVERVAADAADPEALTRHAEGAAALYCCAGPPYPRWATDWPPLGAAFLRAAAATGAVYACTGNLYAYGAVDGPVHEGLPLRPNSVKGRVRARLWEEALAAHESGELRAVEVRGSDYLGPGAVTSFGVMVLPKVLAGRPAAIPADLDAPHSWTYTGDVARTLVAVAADERHWGRPWHVPTPPPVSVRALATMAAEPAGAPRARLRRMPGLALRLAGLFDADAKALIEVQYQFQRPFVLDSTAASRELGIEPTPTVDALRTMLG